MTEQRWIPGRPLSPIEAFIAVTSRTPVYYRHKWTHPGWAASWHINFLNNSAVAGYIREAIRLEAA